MDIETRSDIIIFFQRAATKKMVIFAECFIVALMPLLVFSYFSRFERASKLMNGSFSFDRTFTIAH